MQGSVTILCTSTGINVDSGRCLRPCDEGFATGRHGGTPLAGFGKIPSFEMDDDWGNPYSWGDDYTWELHMISAM